MSLQGLISGSECAATANPLSQVLKHADGDRSFQQDKISGPSNFRLHQLPGSSSSAPASQQDLALARQFFEGNSLGHGMSPGFGIHRNYPPELSRMPEMNGMNEPWALEQQQKLHAFEESAARAAWAAEFENAPQQDSPGPSVQQTMPGRPEFQQQRSSFMLPMYAGSTPMAMYGMNAPMQYGMNANFTAIDQGKGKSREADFEAAFAKIVESMGPEETQTSHIEEADERVAEIEEKLKNATLNAGEDEKDLNFQRVWDQLQNSDPPPPKEDATKWEAALSQLMNAQREELEDYGTNMQKAWEGGVGSYGGASQGVTFDEEGIPILGDYMFEQNNKYLDPGSSRSVLSDAKQLLESNGSLSEAALMLEAAIQLGEFGEGGFESWILLGETRNMDEREEAGMRALLEGVKIAEQAGAHGVGMLSLAISFTNESYDRASHTMLVRWFKTKYPAVPIPDETVKAVGTNSSWDTHERITQLFVDLARSQHGQDQMDPDLQIALGVLYYTNGDYGRAQDCFATALNVRPKDYLLWNRLGSSLSNGNKPEEALGAYREALQIRPTYTRAIYNVGVACLNIGADKEAAEHFLSALALQEPTNGDTSDQLWFTLRRALQSMNRSDLADLAKPEAKSNLDIFRREGFDF